MKRTGLILLISGFWLLVSGFFTHIHAQDETLTILTYYPAPYGVYNNLQIGSWGIYLSGSNDSPNAGYIRFGDNTGWKLHFGRYKEPGPVAPNTGTTGVLMTIQDNGSVGIGTIFPTSDKLDIRTTLDSLTSGVENLPLRIRRHNNTNHTGVGIGFTVSTSSFDVGAKIVHERHENNSIGDLVFYTKGSIPPLGGSLAGDVTNERMRITANGRVGIGTDIPNDLLTVNGDIGLTGDINLENDKNLIGRATNGTYHNLIGLGADNDTYINIINKPNEATSLKIWDAGTSTVRVYVTDNGLVGINTWPHYTLEVNGSAGKPGGGSWTNSSDIRLKKNVAPIEGALDKILMLKGITYQWKEPEKHGDMTGTYMGMLAQDIENVFPEWVGDDGNGYKTLGFIGFEALATEAMRELKSEIDALKTKNAELESRIKTLEDMINIK